jgi:hypothetical protein
VDIGEAKEGTRGAGVFNGGGAKFLIRDGPVNKGSSSDWSDAAKDPMEMVLARGDMTDANAERVDSAEAALELGMNENTEEEVEEEFEREEKAEEREDGDMELEVRLLKLIVEVEFEELEGEESMALDVELDEDDDAKVVEV